MRWIVGDSKPLEAQVYAVVTSQVHRPVLRDGDLGQKFAGQSDLCCRMPRGARRAGGIEPKKQIKAVTVRISLLVGDIPTNQPPHLDNLRRVEFLFLWTTFLLIQLRKLRGCLKFLAVRIPLPVGDIPT
jgi:hypothetical protein